MKRLGMVVAGVLLLTGCGGGGPSEAPEPTATPKLVELADACVLVNTAADETLSDAGLAKPDSLNAFAVALDGIAEKTDSRGRDAIETLATRSREVSETLATSTDVQERLDAGLDMLNGYTRMQDACEAVGAPLSVPG